jgi:hypothetical protein
MKKTTIAIAIFALASGAASAQTAGQDQAKAMEAYTKAAAITTHHEVLNYFVGRWKVESKMWAVPGAPPSESVNTNAGEMILGGRYVRLAYRGQMMGQPFEGLQISGYDNTAQVFTTIWIDNTSTSFYLLKGTYDAAKKTYTFTGRWADPLGGDTPVRMIIRIVSPDVYESETYMVLPDGKDFKSMEMRCTRKK